MLTPCPGDATVSIGFKKNFITHRMGVEPRNTLKSLKGILVSFLPSFKNSFAAFTDTKEANKIRWGREENQ